jgi:hypothetical protein
LIARTNEKVRNQIFQQIAFHVRRGFFQPFLLKLKIRRFNDWQRSNGRDDQGIGGMELKEETMLISCRMFKKTQEFN